MYESRSFNRYKPVKSCTCFKDKQSSKMICWSWTLRFFASFVWNFFGLRALSNQATIHKKTNSQKSQVQFFHPRAQLSSYKILKQQPFKPFQAQSQTSQPTSLSLSLTQASLTLCLVWEEEEGEEKEGKEEKFNLFHCLDNMREKKMS